MSALRLNYPGKPIELIPLGPARGRVTGPQISGGSVWDAIPAIKGRTTFNRPEVKRVRYGDRIYDREPMPSPRCGYVLPILQEPCMRRPHDSRDHRSAAAMEADRARRGKP